MVNFFRVWCENIIIGVVISIIIEMICPERNIKYIKIIIGFFILYLIIHPFISNIDEIKKMDFKKEIETLSSSFTIDDNNQNDSKYKFNNNVKSINENINKTIINSVKENIYEKLISNDIECSDAIIEYDEVINEFIKVNINLVNKKDIEKEDIIKEYIIEEIEVDFNKIYIN